MRPVLFLFYSVEIFLNMVLITFHVEGVIKQPVDYMPVTIRIRNAFYTISLYIYNSVTMWASINLTVGYRYNFRQEIIRCIIGFVLYFIISLWTLNDAETDFHLMYVMKDEKDKGKIIHPFIKYLRLQAIFAMFNGCVYLLHCVIIIDVVLAGIAERESHVDNQRRRKDEPEVDFQPVHIYFLGSRTEMYLEQFKWFNEFKYAKNEDV